MQIYRVGICTQHDFHTLLTFLSRYGIFHTKPYPIVYLFRHPYKSKIQWRYLTISIIINNTNPIPPPINIGLPATIIARLLISSLSLGLSCTQFHSFSSHSQHHLLNFSFKLYLHSHIEELIQLYILSSKSF